MPAKRCSTGATHPDVARNRSTTPTAPKSVIVCWQAGSLVMMETTLKAEWVSGLPSFFILGQPQAQRDGERQNRIRPAIGVNGGDRAMHQAVANCKQDQHEKGQAAMA